jgi:hypothetical protein
MTKTFLADMKTEFPQAPEPNQGIPTLQSLIELFFHFCRCMQMQRSPAFATMNLLFCAAPPDMYALLIAETYPAAFAPFLPIVQDVPDYTECMNNNEHATVKAMHAINKKMGADMVTMNTAFADVFPVIAGTCLLPTVAPTQTEHCFCQYVHVVCQPLWKDYGRGLQSKPSAHGG